MNGNGGLPAELLRRWRALVPGADLIGAELLARYAEPWRHYHDVRHLADVLAGIDALRDHFPDPTAVELAAWFHDAVYLVPGVDGASSTDTAQNEERSAHLAELSLAGIVAAPVVAEVARLVRLTTTHDPAPDDSNGAVLCDADLAVLARPAADYDRYSADVRREYAHVDEASFRLGRATILRSLQAAPSLYRSAAGRERWEQRARANLARELAALGG